MNESQVLKPNGNPWLFIRVSYANEYNGLYFEFNCNIISSKLKKKEEQHFNNKQESVVYKLEFLSHRTRYVLRYHHRTRWRGLILYLVKDDTKPPLFVHGMGSLSTSSLRCDSI